MEENQKRELEAAGDDANKDFGQMSDTPAEESGQDIQSAKERGTVAKLLIIGAVICALAGLFAWNSSKRAGNYSDLQNRAESASTGSTAAVTAGEEKSGAGVTEKAAAAETAATAATAASIAEEVPIDFKNIREDCPDVYAWICIPDTQINYPVCQSPEGVDQDFYLNHRADGTEEFAGSIYSQNYNKKDFSDPNTVLYGHDMSNGSMFQNLHFYEDKEFFDKNREVTVYLPDKVLHYRVFAAYNTSDEHILLKFDCFKDPKVFKQYLKDILAGTYMYSGTIDDDIELTEKSRLLTLSTCNAYDNQRFVVQCVLE